ncbi:methyltransferase domain-containing protein [uncultured Methylobacterium sp.]|jgi:SAM-dependent methyltransferase|uniref:class I SAM-dependent methyltransferase n=1 Tax=uncultured Methylobacterium sp. TaxID=157278 RepID=UPI002620F6B5|nr:methyltransferase domain-containing protein [uncultured Methylobacterium sp.]
MAGSWREFWNRDSAIYVNDRHRTLHYAGLAEEVAALVPHRRASVLDHGCGEALAAERVAAACGRLHLCDGAPRVRAALENRFAGNDRVSVLAPEDLPALADASLDLVVANSLVQYLDAAEFEACLALWRRKLARDGRLILADIIPPDLSALADARALLAFGHRGGFLAAALAGLARTALSDYRTLRRSLGLSRYGEAEMLARLAGAGFAARRLPRNLGHNQARMAFEARHPA